ncbi:hypothetical protein GGS20DRAFT_562200 [Poronia punctata]|nr:hypothetical protein GGS20DRAFT_562200 [Poronia punctata]
MVGIPRSKGCKTCKKKKIKCDERRPRCGPCRKGVRECEGYDTPIIFLNTSSNDFPDSSSSSAYSSSSAPGQKRKNVVRFKNHFAEDVAWQNGHEIVVRGDVRQQNQTQGPSQSQFQTSAVARHVPGASRRVGPYAARRTKQQQQQQQQKALALATPAPRALSTQMWAVENILSRFLETCVPPAATQEAPLAWVASLVSMRKDVDALPLAMSALAFGWAGHVDAQPQLVDKGLQLYNAAVQQLRLDLGACSPLQVLAATALFVVFELCEFGSKGNPGWLTHMQGIAAVLLSLGPEKVSMPPYVQIYSFCRVIFFVQGLRLRKRVCAGSPLWMEGPYRTRKKDALQRLYDLAGEACGMYERADALLEPIDMDGRTEARPKHLEGAEIFHGILDIASRVKYWQKKYRITGISGPCRWPPVDLAEWNLSERATARGYPTKLPTREGWTFDAIHGQRMMHFYWVVLLGLYMTVLDNPFLRANLENCDPALITGLTTITDNNNTAPPRTAVEMLLDESRRLANNIAMHSTSSCHNICESFGSLMSYYNIEQALKWYENHREVAGPLEFELEEHCRVMIAGIEAAESRDPCAFEVTILPEDVLRQQWCEWGGNGVRVW